MSQPNQQLGYEAVIKALKAHSNTILGSSDDELDAGFAAFQKETDRGAVILGATTLEDKLGDRLIADMAHLNSDERSRLFGYDGPLGTFSSKLRIGYALKHLDRRTFKMAELIREMRNACAHSRQGISFEDDALRNAVFQLGAMVDFDISSESDSSAMRFAFLTVIAWLVNFVFAEGDKPGFATFLGKVIAAFEAQRKASAETPPEQSSPTSPVNQTDA